MRRPTPDAINRPFSRPQPAPRRCEHADGCSEEGTHRAPAARNRLNDYVWFCLEHVRAYNRAWDYFAGMNEAEIENQRRADTVWQRPSWPLGHFGEYASTGYRVHDGFGFFWESEECTAKPEKPRTEEEKALAAFDLTGPVTFQDVKARYKDLVKKLHPDANGGDREAEERLKTINQAYSALKMSFA
jgi:DnaJ domain